MSSMHTWPSAEPHLFLDYALDEEPSLKIWGRESKFHSS